MKNIKKRKLNKLLAKGSRLKKKRPCPFTKLGVQKVDYKDTETLKQFVTEGGKILPRRVTGVSAQHQKMLCTAIKRARMVALLPFVGEVQTREK